MYDLGVGVPQDYSEAARWYRKAAKRGSPAAQSRLGFMYYQGQGVAKNHLEATRLYRLAAEQGSAIAQLRLGAAYYNGNGVPQNKVHALAWIILSATQGNKRAVELRDLLRDDFAPGRVAAAEDLSMRIWERIESSE